MGPGAATVELAKRARPSPKHPIRDLSTVKRSLSTLSLYLSLASGPGGERGVDGTEGGGKGRMAELGLDGWFEYWQREVQYIHTMRYTHPLLHTTPEFGGAATWNFQGSGVTIAAAWGRWRRG